MVASYVDEERLNTKFSPFTVEKVPHSRAVHVMEHCCTPGLMVSLVEKSG